MALRVLKYLALNEEELIDQGRELQRKNVNALKCREIVFGLDWELIMKQACTKDISSLLKVLKSSCESSLGKGKTRQRPRVKIQRAYDHCG